MCLFFLFYFINMNSIFHTKYLHMAWWNHFSENKIFLRTTALSTSLHLCPIKRERSGKYKDNPYNHVCHYWQFSFSNTLWLSDLFYFIRNTHIFKIPLSNYFFFFIHFFLFNRLFCFGKYNHKFLFNQKEKKAFLPFYQSFSATIITLSLWKHWLPLL